MFAEVAVPEDAGAAGRRLRDSSGVGGRGAARDGVGRGAGRDDVAVLLAGRVPACHGGVAGAGPDSAGGRGAVSVDLADARACRFCRCGSW